MSPPVAIPIPPQHTEVPMLPVGDGTWNYYDPNPARNRSSRGPPWARRWIKHNQKLCAVLVCGALVICGAGVAFKHHQKGRKDGMGALGQKQLAGAADPCKVSCRHFFVFPRCLTTKSVDMVYQWEQTSQFDCSNPVECGCRESIGRWNLAIPSAHPRDAHLG